MNVIRIKAESALQKVFDIREGEFSRVFTMQLNIFLIISTLMIIKPAINSLFLSEVGIEGLPLAFILVALVAGVIITFYSKILRRHPLNRIIHFTLLISVISISLLILFLKLNYIEKWILYIFYVWVAVFAVLATSQFWILANIVLNPRQAKRLFSIIGGGAIAGGIFGGYLTSILAPIMGSENLLFVGMVFLLLCIPLNKKIWHSNQATVTSVFRRRKRMGEVNQRPLRLIRNSKHLTYLAMITALGVLVAKLVDYQFSAISSERIMDQDELTSFFGFWYSNFNILSLLIQLFITRKVVGTFGVGVSLFFLPAGILVGAVAVLIVPGLWSAVLIKSADGSLKQSVNKAGIELLALPIPSEIKKQAKSFIDVFVDSFATGLSGILLITLVNGFNLSVRFVSLSILVLILIWFYYAVKVRKEYLKLFKLKLKISDDDQIGEENQSEIDKLSVNGSIIKVLESGNEEQILFLLEKTIDIQHKKMFPSVKKLLDHTSPRVVEAAIHKLALYQPENLSKKMYTLVKHPDHFVKVAALEYIIEHSGSDKFMTANKYLNDPDYKVSGAAFYALAAEGRDNPHQLRQENLKKHIYGRLNKLKTVSDPEEFLFRKLNMLRVISIANIPEFYSFILESLNDKNEKIRQQALLAAGITMDGSFIPIILPYLKDSAMKDHAVQSLFTYGHRIIPSLHEELKKGNHDIEIVKMFPAIIEKIESQDGVQLLFDLLDYPELMVRHEALNALNRMKQKKSYLVFNKKLIIRVIYDEAKLFLDTISALYLQQERFKSASSSDQANVKLSEARMNLIRLLEERMDENLERIFKLLELKYPPEEIDTAYKGFKSDNREIRENAIEFLDNLLEPNLKKLLLPILETSIFESISKETIQGLRIKVQTQYDCFSQLLLGKDIQLKLSVIYLLQMLKDKRYLPLLQSLADHHDAEIRSAALKAMKPLSK